MTAWHKRALKLIHTGWLKKVSCCTVSTAYFFELPCIKLILHIVVVPNIGMLRILSTEPASVADCLARHVLTAATHTHFAVC